MGSRPWKFVGLGIGGVLAILAAVTVVFLIFMAIWGFRVTITEAELQSVLDAKLPATESYDLVEVTFKNGTVALEEGSSRIDLVLEVDIKADKALEQAVAEVEEVVRIVVEKILDEKGIEGNPNGSNADGHDGENDIEAPVNGVIHISTEIGYDAKNSVVYLKQPKLEYIEVDETPLAIEDTVNTALEVLAIASLDKIPVHDFGDNSAANWVVRNFMKDLKVENGEVKIDFAL